MLRQQFLNKIGGAREHVIENLFWTWSGKGSPSRWPTWARCGSLIFALCGCMTVPGETLTSGGLQRDIKARVLTLASAANPQCKQHNVTHSEVLELHPDGKVAAERWTVDQCGRRVNYRVSLPPARRGAAFLVNEER